MEQKSDIKSKIKHTICNVQCRCQVATAGGARTVGRGHMASAAAAAYNGGLGSWVRAPARFRGEPLVRGQGQSPLKLKFLEHLASNADGKFAKNSFYFANSFCKSQLVEKIWVWSMGMFRFIEASKASA